MEKESEQMERGNGGADVEALAAWGGRLRTPLAAVMGYLDTLSSTRLDRDQRELVETAVLAADELMATVQGEIDRMKASAGRLVLREDWHNLREYCQRVAGVLGAQAGSHGLRLIHSLDGELEPWWRFDRVKVRQLLMNLTTLVMQATPRGSLGFVVSRANFSGGVKLTLISFEASANPARAEIAALAPVVEAMGGVMSVEAGGAEVILAFDWAWADRPPS